MTPQELAAAAGCTPGPIQELRRKKLVSVEVRRVHPALPDAHPVVRVDHLMLNPDQQAALQAILEPLRKRRHETILIHGVTGSGKTEVYIQAIEEVIQFGRQAIVLVPEISLTPQTRRRFRSRFDRVAVLHSHLTTPSGTGTGGGSPTGEVQVVVGARSAVFAPTPHLGLIVLDEEHEASFKQETAPRYHARDVAVAAGAGRAGAAGARLGHAVAGELARAAQRGEYRLVDMPRRVSIAPLPDVATIDLRTPSCRDAQSRGRSAGRCTRPCSEALRDGGQVILLLNRRGFSTTHPVPGLRPRGASVPHCDIALTHHGTARWPLCHYCDYEIPAPTALSGVRVRRHPLQRAGHAAAGGRGAGPLSRRAVPADGHRHDGQAGQPRGGVGRFRAGEVQILLGTQMIAKGLDFPNVTLVGVINADTALHLPDFRAAERTFQLVTQVAGRTGRGRTRRPRAGADLQSRPSGDRRGAAARLRAVRRPGTADASRVRLSARSLALIRIVVRGPVGVGRASSLRNRSPRGSREESRPPACRPRMLGPVAAPMPKLRGNFRFHMLLYHADQPALLRSGARGHRAVESARGSPVDRRRGSGRHAVSVALVPRPAETVEYGRLVHSRACLRAGSWMFPLADGLP